MRVIELSSYSRILLEKVIVAQVIKKLSAFHGTLMFISVFIGSRP
jgi:hypothetical protein